ncbi:YdbH domain-containing protein [Shewanella sp. UCD-KL12]|uniref:intermembrane phospholipid transport protein YdbH family protein n=1 Tax=Shewanella sp. UCD-KL12 TaxID=1917163 RepID=UPI00097102BB|nr:YdbH domain-containing protein [Shewanella sp. UCD-KL12]
MLSHSFSAKRRLLAILFSLIALVLILLNTYELLAKKVANHYFAEYNTQISHLSIRPTSLHQWHVPELSLTVHDSQIIIKDLALTLDEDINLFSLLSQPLSASQVMSSIEAIAIKAIQVDLNPSVLTDEGKNVDEQGPTAALDLNALPQIEIGATSLSLAGIPPSTLSLTMEHLTLDETGHLSTAISRQGSSIFQLDAQLTEDQWHVSSQLVFGELYTFLGKLAAQKKLDKSALAPLLTFKQESEQAGLALNGTLASSATLDLKSAQLTSSHTLKKSSLTLKQFEGLVLAPQSLSSLNQAPSAIDSLKFEISGHLAQLNLLVHPFTLEVNPSTRQINSLLPLIHNDGITPLIKAMLEPRAMTPQPDNKPSEKSGNQPSDKSQQLSHAPQAIKLSLTLSEPLEYAFSSKEMVMNHAQLSIHDAIVDAQLSANDLTLQLPTDSQGFALQSEWQFAASREQTLRLSQLMPNKLIPNMPMPNKLNVFTDDVCGSGGGNEGEGKSDSDSDNMSDCDRKAVTDIELGASSISMAGHIDIDTDAKQASQFTLSIKPDLQAQINSVSHKGNQPRFTFELSKLKLVSHDEMVMTSNEKKPINIALPRLTLSTGPSHYQHSIHKDTGSLDNEISFDVNELELATHEMSLFTLSSFTSSSFTLAPFSLASTQAAFEQVYKSGKSLSVSTGITRFISQDQMVIKQVAHSKSKDSQDLEISIPPISLAQVDNALAFKPLPTADKSEYIGQLTDLHFALEKPSSLVIPGLTSLGANAMLSRLLDKNRWHNLARYELNGLALTHHHLKNRRKRADKLLDLYTVSLSQPLDWSGTQLDTQESWSFDGLEFSSEHSLQPLMTADANHPDDDSALMLTGSVNLVSDLGNILSLVNNNYTLPESLFMTGETQLQADYVLNKSEHLTRVNINFSPELTSLSGSINDLPFEQADIQARCHYQMEKLNQSKLQEPKEKNSSTLACPDIQFSAAAFNPGVLITDIKAQADFSISHDDSNPVLGDDLQNEVPPAHGAKNKIAAVPDTLSAADIQVNASGALLGGQLLLPEFNLRLHDKSHGYLVLQGLELEQLLAIQPQIGVYADGVFDGVLPVDFIKGEVAVSGGRLAARAPGGLISVSGNPAVDQMRLSQPYLDFAFSTMEHLAYSELASTFDMDTTGDAVLKVSVKGKAKGIERPIHLNYSQEENMLQLLKSLQIGDKLQTQIEQSMN